MKSCFSYLDYNVYVDASNDKKLLSRFEKIAGKGIFSFIFSHTHIEEVIRYSENINNPVVNSVLDVIKKISGLNYLEYNERDDSYFIIKRCPFEVFRTMTEVSDQEVREVLEGSLSDADELLGGFTNIKGMGGLFTKFSMSARSQFPDLGDKLNHLPRREAFDKLIDLLGREEFQQVECYLKKGGMKKDFIVDIFLTIFGYHTPNKEMKKGEGLLSDHQHLNFCRDFSLLVIEDKRLRTKAKKKYNNGDKCIVDLKHGLILMELMSGVITIKNKKNIILNNELIEIIVERFK